MCLASRGRRVEARPPKIQCILGKGRRPKVITTQRDKYYFIHAAALDLQLKGAQTKECFRISFLVETFRISRLGSAGKRQVSLLDKLDGQT